MNRQEEHARVDTRMVEDRRAQLRKYVVTEQQSVPSPVSGEEVGMEREPTTDTSRGDVSSGAGITNEEHGLVPHADPPSGQ